MKPAWEAEIEVDAELTAQLITSQFPALANRPITAFSNGWDNTGFLVDERWVFRFPRRHIAVPLLEQEIRILPVIAPRLLIAIPAPVYIGRATPSYPYPFAGYRLISGQTACRAGLDDAAWLSLAEPLACFLRSLHGIPPKDMAALGVVPDQLRRLDVAHRTPPTLKRLDGMLERSDASPAQVTALRTIIVEADGLVPCRQTTLVHGDLYVRHLVVGNQGSLNGIIDWGDLHLGDPAMDLMAAFLVLPPVARQRFFAAYGGIDDNTRRLARFRAVVHLGYLLEFAHAIADQALREEMRREVGYLLDPEPYSSRT